MLWSDSTPIRLVVVVSVSIAAAAVALDAASARAQTVAVAPALSLKISNEIAPPGGLVQMKVFVTEPKPISTGFASMSLDAFDEVVGIALGSSTNDALGVAVRNGASLAFSIVSPSTTFGMTPDYPVLTVVGRVSAAAALGTRIPVSMDPGALQFFDPNGVLYPATINSGSVRVEPHIGIEEVTPGSGVAHVGDVVRLVGRDFRPDTEVRVKESALSSIAFIDPSHLDVTFALETRLQGAAFQAINRDNAQSRYFSYQRTSRQAATVNPTLQAAVPIFADADVTAATVRVSGYTTGLALQNRRGPRAFAVCELVDATGARIAARIVAVDTRRFVLQDLSEIFGTSYSPSDSVRVLSLTPIQVMGVAVDSAGGAVPIAPQ